MPIIAAAPYDTADYILKLARSISNDAATTYGLDGDILADSQPYVYPILSKCYRDLQDQLITGGVETVSTYGIITGITPAQSTTPLNVTIGFLGYWDGATTWDAIALPPDLIKPLEIWRSLTGLNQWIPMKPVPDSILPSIPQPMPSLWDFQSDLLIFPGSTQTFDMRLKYLCTTPDLTGPDSTVYVLHAQTALANMLVAAVSKMLGGVEMASVFDADAKTAINLMINRTARKEAYSSFQRVPFRNHRRSGGGYR